MEHEWNMNGTLVDRLLSKMAGNAPNFPWRSVAGKSPSDGEGIQASYPGFPLLKTSPSQKAAGIGSGIGDSSCLNYSDINPKSHNRVCFASLAFIPTPESSLLSCLTPYTSPCGKKNHRSNPFKLSISKKTLKPPFHSTSTPFLF